MLRQYNNRKDYLAVQLSSGAQAEPLSRSDFVAARRINHIFIMFSLNEFSGDAQELYRKHQQDLEELEKNQMINKARQEQGLEEKLRARRSRRQRQAAINAELEVETGA